jgi:membrane-associated phospholipid phosphatase
MSASGKPNDVSRHEISGGDGGSESTQEPSSILVADPGPGTRAQQLRHAALVAAAGYLALVILMLAIGLALTHPLDHSVGRWDESVNRWFADHRTPLWNSVTEDATWMVDTVPAIAVAFVITAVLAWRHRWREAAMLVFALALELVVFLSVTWLVARPRPDVVRLNASPSTSSFPSGHTAAATVLLAGLAIIVTCCTRNTVLRVSSYVFAVAAAVLVGFGRVYRGMHHPTDVIAGAVLGAGCLVVAVLVVRTVAVRAAPPARTNVEPESQEVRTRVA